MRIQLQDSYGMGYQLTSSDPQIIGVWFAEHVPAIMSANSTINHPLLIDVYPSSQDEFKAIGNSQRLVGKPGWLDLIEYMGKLAEAMPDQAADEPV